MQVRHCLSGLFLLVSFCSLAQNYCGRVVDEAGKTLESASVYLLSIDSTVIRYTHTDASGRFCIQAADSPQAAYLAVSYIGFSAKRIPLSEYREGSDIGLSASDVKIREVKVSANRIRMTGDTLTYSMAGFKTPQDRTVRDVLARIPGIRVSDDGGITYQGESINKFYIEGIDLLGENYKLASNNLQANHVKEIQVLENHEPVKSLAGKTFSEQAAVNLILEDQAKARWLGNFDLGVGGMPLKWSNRLMGVAFNKRSQQLNMYKNDNTGENLGLELMPVINVESVAQEQQNLNVLRPILSPVSLPAPPIDSKRYRMNRDHLLSTNQLYKLTSDSHLRFQVSYMNNTLKNENQALWTYYPLPDSSFHIREEVRQRNRQHHLQANLKYEQNSASSYLSNELKIQHEFDKNEINMFANHYPLSQKYDMPSFRAGNEFKWLIPKNTYRLELASSLLFHHAPGRLHITSEEIYGGEDSLTYIRQDAYTKDFVMRNELKHSFPAGPFQLSQKLGLDYVYQELYSSAPLAPVISGNSSFNDDLSYGRLDAYYEPAMLFRNRRLLLNASAKLSYKRHQLNPQVEGEASFQPKVNAQYDSGWWLFKVGASRNRQYNYLQSLHTGWMWTNYRNIQAGQAVFSPGTTTSYNAGLSYRNPIQSLFFSLSAIYRVNSLEQIAQTSYVDNLITVSRYMAYKYRTSASTCMFSFSKTLGAWNTRLFLDLAHLQTGNAHLAGETFSSYRNQTNMASGRIYIQPVRQFNSQYEINVSQNRLQLIKPQQQGNYPATTYLQHKLDTWFTWSKLCQTGITQTFYHGKAMPGNIYFLDAKLLFKIKNKELSLIASNLFDKKEMHFQTYQTYRSNETTYLLTGRYLLLGFSFPL